jgi:hypothetical protein
LIQEIEEAVETWEHSFRACFPAAKLKIVASVAMEWTNMRPRFKAVSIAAAAAVV